MVGDSSMLTKPQARYCYLLQAIRTKRYDLVNEILHIEKNYFYNGDFNGDIKEEVCYCMEAIKLKNSRMLKLLMSYGLSVPIFGCKVYNSEENPYSDLFGGSQYISIDPQKPFITDDISIMSIIIDNITNINKSYLLYWQDRSGREYHVTMTLLAIALYFDSYQIAELLVKKGALFDFNLFSYMIELTMEEGVGFGYFGSVYRNPLLSGYMCRGNSNRDLLELNYGWSPIPIIFNKGNSKLIEWLMRHIKNDMKAQKEINIAALRLKGKVYAEFAIAYPQIAASISLEDILDASNHMALKIYIENKKPKITTEDIKKLISFKGQLEKGWISIGHNLITKEFLLCIMEIYRYDRELLKTEDISNQIFNIIMYMLYIGNLNQSLIEKYARSYNQTNTYMYINLNKSIGEFMMIMKRCQRVAEGLLHIYTDIGGHIPDVTDFVSWYYSQQERMPLKVIKSMLKEGTDIRPRLNIDLFDNMDGVWQGQNSAWSYKGASNMTIGQLTDIVDIFEPYESDKKKKLLPAFYKIAISKNNIRLTKKMISYGYFPNERLEAMIEYAIEIKSYTILPYLITNQWEESEDSYD